MEMQSENKPVSNNQMEIIDVENFDYEGFQIVRGEFFGHVFEPCIVFNNKKVYVNTACVRQFPDTDYVHIGVNAEKKLLIVKPVDESTKDSVRWIREKNRSKPKQISCLIFYAKVFTLMEWDFNNRYRLLGKLIRSKGEMFFLFDLKTPEIFIGKTVDGKTKVSRTASYPDDWKNHFGLSVKEHQANLQVNIYNGYAFFAIEDKNTKEAGEQK